MLWCGSDGSKGWLGFPKRETERKRIISIPVHGGMEKKKKIQGRYVGSRIDRIGSRKRKRDGKRSTDVISNVHEIRFTMDAFAWKNEACVRRSREKDPSISNSTGVDECEPMDTMEQNAWIEELRKEAHVNNSRWTLVYRWISFSLSAAYFWFVLEQRRRPWQRIWHAHFNGVFRSETLQVLDSITSLCFLCCGWLFLRQRESPRSHRKTLASVPFKLCVASSILVSMVWVYGCWIRGSFAREAIWLIFVPTGYLGLCGYVLMEMDKVIDHVEELQTCRYAYKKV